MRLALLKKPLPGLRHRLAHWAGAAIDHSPYSHSNLVFSNGQSGSSWAGHGVGIRSIEYDLSMWDFFTLPDHLERAARRWFELAQLRQVGYDHFGVLRFAISIFTESPSRDFCHEAIAKSMGFSEAWRCGPGVLLSRCIDHLGAVKVDSPWTPERPPRVHPALEKAVQR